MTNDKQFQVLRHCVLQALEGYFAKLDGQKPVGLYSLVMRELEVPLLETVLRHADNNQTIAAKNLGLSRGTLRKKLQTYKLCSQGKKK